MVLLLRRNAVKLHRSEVNHVMPTGVLDLAYAVGRSNLDFSEGVQNLAGVTGL